eukprot:scaffold14937_cov57-Phaeocystis_antarctica.AAC.5
MGPKGAGPTQPARCRHVYEGRAFEVRRLICKRICVDREPVSSPPSSGTLIIDATPTHVRPRPPPGPPRLAPRLLTPRLPTQRCLSDSCCHPPRDTRCRPRRVSHHPSLRARQKQRLATN